MKTASATNPTAVAYARSLLELANERNQVDEIGQEVAGVREVLEQHPEVAGHARQAIERAGLVVHPKQIRGGTDGSRLSFMGLPTPNLFAGQHNIHSRLEWTSAEDMVLAVEVIVHLCEVWAARA